MNKRSRQIVLNQTATGVSQDTTQNPQTGAPNVDANGWAHISQASDRVDIRIKGTSTAVMTVEVQGLNAVDGSAETLQSYAFTADGEETFFQEPVTYLAYRTEITAYTTGTLNGFISTV